MGRRVRRRLYALRSRLSWRASLATASLILGLATHPVPAQVRETDTRDILLAALGSETLRCLGTVGPAQYSTASGVLARTFDACTGGDPSALERIDALLSVPFSAQGLRDALSEHYVATWNAFTRSFPRRLRNSCPVWTLRSVIDAPTPESIDRFLARGWPGKENHIYEVAAPQCGGRGACAVARARTCAGGFGSMFVARTDAARSTVEVDPVWWLTHYTYRGGRPGRNPFDDGIDPWIHGYCRSLGNDPGSMYASLDRVGEACCRKVGGKVYFDGVFNPIDCGGGWFCMAYCGLPQPTAR
jgi:hypothetical protein